MPPRRHPRSWLAGRLRSAAGAVQRLAARVEPAGQPSPPSATPVATPRRFGEPPQHWLDLVAAHAPGLLHDLDLDQSAAEPAEGRDDPAGGSGFGDRTDLDGPDRWTAATRPTQPVGAGAGLPADAPDRRAPGTLGRAPGTGGGLGRATSVRGPDLAAHSDGRGRPASATPGTAGDDDTVGAAYGLDGPQVMSGGGPDVSHPAGETGRSGHASSAADRSGSQGIGGASPRGGSDVADDAMTVEVPLASDGYPPPPGRPLDGWHRSAPPRQVAATEPQRHDAPTAHPSAPPRISTPHPTPTPTPTEILEGFGPSRGSYLPRSTPDDTDLGGGGAGGVVAGGGLWPELPDDRARSGQQDGERVGGHTGHRNGPATTAAGVAWIGSEHHDPGGGPGPASTVLQADATAFDRWPALPDDATLWSVADAAVDTAHLTRLDREQAGG